MHKQQESADRQRAENDGATRSAPAISLPTGGGAIRGIGEKFANNPATGTGSMSIPIATAPGRSGFGPQLLLSYDSSAGNGPFGLGWSLGLPQIARKTDRGLPQYLDTNESDVFILSGADDLAPALIEQLGQWQREELPPRTVNGIDYHLQCYRPRIEGLFARLERWTAVSTGESHWRSISKDNVTTVYGKDAESRVADPANPNHIFTWFICESYDDKGNAIVYHYAPEDSTGVVSTQAHERNRTVLGRSAGRYLKRIRYGNRTPRQPGEVMSLHANSDWMFEVVFDYEEGHYNDPQPDAEQSVVQASASAIPKSWAVRQDPFSTCRAGFEIRTYRLCRRILLFHHIPDVPAHAATGTPAAAGYDGLVRATQFKYLESPLASFMVSVMQSGFKLLSAGSYLRKSLPPTEFTYSQAEIHDEIREIDAASLDNLPMGLDGSRYQWVDLDGEGVPGILTEQAGAWFYKRNIGPISSEPPSGRPAARFQAVERVAQQPAAILTGGAERQFLDLAGDGSVDLVEFDSPTPGFYERTIDGGWENFRVFDFLPNLRLDDQGLKFIDLTGDGHADILITDEEVFTWYLSLGEAGFGPAESVRQFDDEEKGPRLVFTDRGESIFMADMSGDGLTDLVRIRNGEVCYWPNLGYGRFGTKVTMDASPFFDAPDQFDPRRLRLADIDGSGVADIFYLGREGTTVFLNHSGNRWAGGKRLNAFPPVDRFASVQAVDLFGNGTACLVWSSPMPGASRQPMRYLDLMGGQKPHLLIKSVNNLGAETRVSYAPSTKFYLQDKFAGKPWITRLPFPVHCVEQITVTDKWRKIVFSSAYSYHHGYFDGFEREFRGFGRVEQVDAESYGTFAAGNAASPYITQDKTLYQPPVKTVTWYHTGAFLDRERILSQFEHEYFPRGLEDLRPGLKILGTFQDASLPQPDLAVNGAGSGAEDLSSEEWREALRACKGMVLRQEIYELDVDAFEIGEQQVVKLFSIAAHNCHIQRLQPMALNRHAVFLATEIESISYHYELDLRPTVLTPDPRIVHTMNLQFDEHANILQSVAVVYPRTGKFEDDAGLAAGLAGSLPLIHQVQQERHLSYTETRYTKAIVPTVVAGLLTNPDTHRLRVPCEVLTYELTGLNPKAGFYFTFEELRAYRLSLVHQASGTTVAEIPYHQLPTGAVLEKRLVQSSRTLFFADDLSGPLPLGQLGQRGLVYETYKLALTENLLGSIFGAKLAPDVRSRLSSATVSGYLSGSPLAARFPGLNTAGEYWIRSGIAGFASDAAQHFFLPERYIDLFGNVLTLQYDSYDLFVQSSVDAMNNSTRVTRFDFRVLAPREISDINENLSEVFFDVLGLPTAVAVKGKGTEGDDLTGTNDALSNPDLNTLAAFFDDNAYDEAQARAWLGNATARHVYYFGETRRPDGSIAWGSHPACACGIFRERHVSQLAPGEKSPLQTSFEYSDGMGAVLVKKVQAEPEAAGKPLRWVSTGKTILNNKGKPVKQFEPYFSPPAVGHRFKEPVEMGVTAVIYYDAVGRVVRTELPDGSYSRTEFSPWHSASYDPNDTALEPGNAWFALRTAPAAGPEDKRAAQLTAEHAGTPVLAILDSLGRAVISVAHNRMKDTVGVLQDEKYLTFTKLDAEGKPFWLRDSRKNLVMQYITPPVPNNQIADPLTGFTPCYDMAGNLLFHHSMDAGDRWLLNDATGKSLYAWNSRGHRVRTGYDGLHRPTAAFVKGVDPADANKEVQFEKIIYGETPGNGLIVDPKQLNLRGKIYLHGDTAGLITNLGRKPAALADEAYDFKGNLLRSTRQLLGDFKNTPDWSQAPALEGEKFTSSTVYDALSRPVQLLAPHSNQPGAKCNVMRPGYNEANLLQQVDVWLEQSAEPSALLNPATASLRAVTNIDYDAKAQRTRIEYGNGVRTDYIYEKDTFRLSQLLTTRSPGSHLQSLNYTYDPVGNITSIRDDAQQTVFFNSTIIEPSNAYVYDPLYRLIRAEGREHAAQNNAQRDFEDFKPVLGIPFPNSPEALQRYVERYEYDSAGNILRLRHQGGAIERWVRRHQYALDSNRLLASRAPGDPVNLPDYTAAPGYSAAYPYDAHGNMLGMPHLQEMRWDFQDQLHMTQRQKVNALDIDGGNRQGERTWYVYDASGKRVRKVTEFAGGARKNESLYLGGLEIFRRSGASPLARETLHITDDKQRIALVETRTLGTEPGVPPQLIRYQFGNHLGSASLEIDDLARIISYEEYTPYGSTAYQATHSLTQTPKRYRYTGKERDEESGLYYHGARYYAPWLTRWVSHDPAGLVDGTNLYVYARCQPIVRLDERGTDSSKFQDPKQRLVDQISSLGGDCLDPAKFTEAELQNRYQEAQAQQRRRAEQQGPALDKEPAGSITYVEFQRRSALYLQNLDTLAKSPLATILSAGTILQGADQDELAAQLHRAEGPVGALTAIAAVKTGKDNFQAANQAAARTPSPPAIERSADSGSKSGGLGEPASKTPQTVTIAVIPGQKTAPASSKEAATFKRSVQERRERGTFKVEGKTISLIGQRLSLDVPKEVLAGGKVDYSIHTHPYSRIAAFSRADVQFFNQAGSRGSTHEILGEKFPLTNRFLRSIGQDAEPMQVVKTTVSDENLRNVEYREIQFSF